MEKKAAIIVVGLQGYFTTLKKGSLAVAGADQAYVEQVRQAMDSLRRKGYPIYATQDWHPPDHVSFHTSHPGKEAFEMVEVAEIKQILWPPRCVQQTENAEALLDEKMFTAIVQNGQDRKYDCYSGFQDDGGARTELVALLKEAGIKEIIVYGLATHFCVKATALDAVKAGYKVTVIEGLSRVGGTGHNPQGARGDGPTGCSR